MCYFSEPVDFSRAVHPHFQDGSFIALLQFKESKGEPDQIVEVALIFERPVPQFKNGGHHLFGSRLPRTPSDGHHLEVVLSAPPCSQVAKGLQGVIY